MEWEEIEGGGERNGEGSGLMQMEKGKK